VPPRGMEKSCRRGGGGTRKDECAHRAKNQGLQRQRKKGKILLQIHEGPREGGKMEGVRKRPRILRGGNEPGGKIRSLDARGRSQRTEGQVRQGDPPSGQGSNPGAFWTECHPQFDWPRRKNALGIGREKKRIGQELKKAGSARRLKLGMGKELCFRPHGNQPEERGDSGPRAASNRGSRSGRECVDDTT